VSTPFPRCGTASQPASRLASRQAQQKFNRASKERSQAPAPGNLNGRAGEHLMVLVNDDKLGTARAISILSFFLPPLHSGNWLPRGRDNVKGKKRVHPTSTTSDLRTDQRLTLNHGHSPNDLKVQPRFVRRVAPDQIGPVRLNTKAGPPFPLDSEPQAG